MTSPTATKMTVEEYLAWGERPENAGRKTELVDGEILDIPPPSHPHGAICYLLAKRIGRYFDDHPPGYAGTNDSGIVVAEETVRGVDIAVYTSPLTAADAEAIYSPKTPAVCVEVVSPSDRPGMTQKRVSQYLAAGVPLVWIIDPQDRCVLVHRAGAAVELLQGDAELTGGDELPGFVCQVSGLFPPPRN